MDRVTRAEAARVLELNRATVTRWIQKNPALIDDEGRVSVDELRRHRDQVVNPKLQTRIGPGRGGDGSPEAGPENSGPSPRASGGLNHQRQRTETVKASLAELELAEKLRMTLRRDDVEAAVAAAAEVLKQKAMAMARDRAEALARIVDVREMERALEQMMRDLLAQGSQALSLAAIGSDPTHAT
jgi:hypothetical protein